MSINSKAQGKEADAGAPAAEEPVPNGYAADAQERLNRLRAMAAEFPDEKEPRPLTPAEIRLARITTVTALEKAALFVEAAPGVGTVANAADLRDAIAFELAYGGLRSEAQTLARQVDHAILRRKLKAVYAARGLYRMAKAFITVDSGDSMRTHFEAMRQALIRPRRRPPTAPGDGPDIEPALKK